MKKLVKLLPAIIISIAIVIILLLTFWAIYPYNPLVLKNVTLDRTEVNRGEHIVVSYDYCKYINKPANVFIKFIDGLENNVPMFVSDFPEGCRSSKLSIYVPKALPTGKFILTGRYEYKVNPIRTIKVNNLFGEFNIIK